MHKNNDMDEICADLLSELPIINHDKELDENDNRNDLSTNNGNTYHRSRRIRRTQHPSENIRSLETNYVAENIFTVPEDDYGFWYEDTTNDTDNSLPYYSIEHLNSIVDTTARNERPEGTCVICLDSKANQIIIPCGHMCMCAVCVGTLTDTYDKECPLCKGQIENIIRVIPS
ncbi:putative E3 ubiquitin-protein ligase XBOS34 [Formica fusca]